MKLLLMKNNMVIEKFISFITFIKKSLELGVNFFDTVIIYSHGISEEFMRRDLRDFANRDESVAARRFIIKCMRIRVILGFLRKQL